ncbi:MAG: hypothetical protein JKY67_17265, partial [Pseudomonadales bacterium]|nr:hypothetical protein [Pseudomonadales bacterium]
MNLQITVKSKIVAIALIGILGFSFQLALNVYSGQKNRLLIDSLSTQELVAISTFSKLETYLQRYKSSMIDVMAFEDWSLVEESDSLSEEIIDSYYLIKTMMPTLKRKTEKVIGEFENYRGRVTHYVEISLGDNTTESELSTATRALTRTIKALEKSHSQLGEAIYKNFDFKLNAIKIQERRTTTNVYVLGAVLFPIIFLLTFYISRSVARSIQVAVKVAGNIAKGNLVKQEYALPNDDTGLLLRSLDVMRKNIEETQRGLKITADFTDAMNSETSRQSISLAAIAMRDIFNLPCVGVYVVDKDGLLECLNIDSLDKRQINHELFSRLDIAENCFRRQQKTSLLISDIAENIQFNFIVGTADLVQIDGYPLFYGERCIGVIILTHISKPSREDLDLIDGCIDRLSGKMNTFLLDQERITLLNHLQLRTQELETLNEENILISQSKSEFLACMSHEIRTPMNGVIGMLGLMRKSESIQQQQYYAKLASKSANSLLLIINDILDFSKIGARKLDLEAVNFDLREELSNYVESMAQQAQDKGLELILDLGELNHSTVVGDPGRIRQIITNLMSNAIKFTKSGEVVIRASTTTLSNSRVAFSCSIIDNGIGIHAENIDNIFNSFTQADTSTTREYGGTGLGLAIVKQLSELMGGDISVKSEHGTGAEFVFSLEMQINQDSLSLPPSVDLNDNRILI